MIKRKAHKSHLLDMTERARMIIEDNPIAIATINDGEPHVAAASYAKVTGNRIILSVIHMKKTIENIRNNPRVSLIVWNHDWAGYQIDGIAEYFDSGEWMEGESCKGALVINIEKIQEIV